MPTIAESIMSEAAQGGTVFAYQVGCIYQRFTGAPREALADTFDRHGFNRVAKSLRAGAVDERKALAHVCARPGRGVKKQGLHVVAVKHTDGDHTDAWVICRASEVGAEDVEHSAGARVFACPAGIYSADPMHGRPADPECRALADSLADRARMLAHTVDCSTLSRACSDALNTVRAFQYISKGSYILRSNEPGANRIVGLYTDLRTQFYNESTRDGVQASVVPVTVLPANKLALSDSVINAAEEQLVELRKKMKEVAGSSKTKDATLESHRAAAQRMLDGLRPLRELLGDSTDRLERLTRAVIDQYESAKSASELVMPDWLDAEIGALGEPEKREAGPSASDPVCADDEPETETEPESETEPDADDPFAPLD